MIILEVYMCELLGENLFIEYHVNTIKFELPVPD